MMSEPGRRLNAFTVEDVNHLCEHVRRMAEIANVLLDTGLILIITAVELPQADLRLFETVVDPERICTIWVGGSLTTDIRPDLRLEDHEAAGEAAVLVKRMLQDHGFLFRP